MHFKSQVLDKRCGQLSAVQPGPDPMVPTVFHSRWWLDAATGGDYHEAQVRSDGRLVARLPYIIQRRLGGRMCTMPELTHYLGPVLDVSAGSPVTRSLRRFQLAKELLAQLPPVTALYQKLHRDSTDTLAFEDAGCSSLVQFTYEIAPAPEQLLWRALRDKTRNVIRRAEERLEVVAIEPGEFAALYDANLRSRGLVNIYTRIPQACAAAIARGQGRILAARDQAGELRGATFTLWDSQAAYHLMSTRTPGIDNGAMSLLVWTAIRDATRDGRLYDFDGLGTPGSRLFYTGFGGQITPRFVASRYSLRHRIAGKLSRSLAQRRRPSSPD